MWIVYHKAIAVNVWRRQICPRISIEYGSCLNDVPETVLHCLVECPRAVHAWEHAKSTLYSFLQVRGPWSRLLWQQCLLGSPLPPKLKKAKTILAVLRGSVMWCVWLDKNASIFTEVPWIPEVRELRIWEVFVEAF